MRTSFGQKTQVPGHGNGLVSTVTGVTPESVRTGRNRSRRTNSDSSAGCAPANARKPAMISDFENSPRPCFGWRRTIRSRPRASSAGSRSTASMIAHSAARCGAGSKSARDGARLHDARKVSEGRMNEATVDALAAINTDFYRDHAAEFSATRSAPWPGWEPLAARAARRAGRRRRARARRRLRQRPLRALPRARRSRRARSRSAASTRASRCSTPRAAPARPARAGRPATSWRRRTPCPPGRSISWRCSR